MKLLFVTPFMTTGGTEKIVYELSRGLKARGASVAVATTGGHLADSLEEEGIRVHQVAVLNKRTPMPLSRAVWQLRRLLKNEKYDIVNSHSFISAMVSYLAILTSGREIKHVFTLHIPEKKSYYRVMGQTLNRIVDQVITVCADTMTQLVRHGVNERRISVIYNGVDTEKFPFVHRDTPRKDIRIGIVARLIERKGHLVLFKSIQEIIGKHDLKLHVIGDGPNRENLETAAREMGLKDYVIFLGDCRDIPGRLKELDLFVLPSFYEGFPVTILEALSSGLPVIASAVNGITEIIEDRENGILVEPGQTEALAKAIELIIDNNDLRRRVIKNGRRSVEEEFSLKIMIDTYKSKFSSMCSSESLL